MTKRKYRTDEEWLSLIQECRLSGLTDKQWCETHQICPSNFYYQIHKFRKRACEIPESHSKTTLTAQKQEVVQVTFEQSAVSEQNILSPVYQRTQRQMQQFLCRLMAFRSESQMQRPKVQSFILCQRCIACDIQCLSPAKRKCIKVKKRIIIRAYALDTHCKKGVIINSGQRYQNEICCTLNFL